MGRTVTETGRINELRGDPSALYEALRSCALALVPAVVKCRLPQNRMEEIAHDATARIMERMERNPSYRIKSVRQVLGYEIRGQVYDRKLVAWESRASPLQDAAISEKSLAEPGLLSDLLVQPDGQRIVLEIYYAKSFRSLCLRLESVNGMRWLCDNVQAVKSVYDNTRGLKCRERRRGRPSESQDIAPLIRLLMRRSIST